MKNTNFTSNDNMNMNTNKTLKTGLKKFGFVENLATCLNEFNALMPDLQQLSFATLNAIADAAEVHHLSRYGYESDYNGAPIAEDKRQYLYFCTGRKSREGLEVIGWYERKNASQCYRGVNWGTMDDLRQHIKFSRMFRLGDLYFEKETDGLAFLEDVAASTIPETWSFRNKPSSFNHPILKSYIENIFEVLKHEAEKGAENKLIFSKDGKHMVFNANLLDRFFHEVLIVVDVRHMPNGTTLYLNPRRVRKDLDLLRLNFEKNTRPAQPAFFEKVEEVIFHTSWNIDKDFDKFTHIIEERRSRFPQEYQNEASDSLARKLDEAISFAVAIAQRNYKFIVPMYRPQTGQIQLLMPIYLNGSYSTKPDFALILTPDRENEYYIPETILPLDAVYQNARLIAKPDDTWLNPDTIL